MSSICQEINTIIKMALDSGNEIKEESEGWSKAKQVISMKRNLDSILKNKIKNEITKLRYWKYDGSPHDEPDEGFTCDECKVVISFPAAHKVIR